MTRRGICDRRQLEQQQGDDAKTMKTRHDVVMCMFDMNTSSTQRIDSIDSISSTLGLTANASRFERNNRSAGTTTSMHSVDASSWFSTNNKCTRLLVRQAGMMMMFVLLMFLYALYARLSERLCHDNDNIHGL